MKNFIVDFYLATEQRNAHSICGMSSRQYLSYPLKIEVTFKIVQFVSKEIRNESSEPVKFVQSAKKSSCFGLNCWQNFAKIIIIW